MTRVHVRIFLFFNLAILASATPGFERSVKPVLARHCLSCHNDRIKTGGLSLQSPNPNDEVLLEKLQEKLRSKTMPPPPMRQPPAAETQAIQNWIAKQLAAYEKKRKPVAGRVTARRLNRAEYNNTIRDLLGVDFRPADSFPSDDSGYGFDNNGDVLTVSPVLMEKYLSAAEAIASKAISIPKNVMASTRVYRNENGRFISDLAAKHNAAIDAEYQINIFAAVTGKGTTPQMPLALTLNGAVVQSFIVDTTPNRNRVFSARIRMTEGEHALRATLVEEAQKSDQDNATRTRASIDGMEVQGPYNPAAPKLPDSHKRIFVCGLSAAEQTSECARKILAELQRRAFRRPVLEVESARYVRLFEAAAKEGASFEEAIAYSLQAILVSPQFLFRIESDAATSVGANRVG